MLLRNVCIVGEEDVSPKELWFENNRIQAVLPTGALKQDIEKKKAIVFNNAIAFPALANSHEHLDFNCFPPIANKVYTNYREWGNDIHLQNKPAINEVLQIPQSLRTQWGVYKNLLNGFTRVVNHGDQLTIENSLINVEQQYTSLHSVGFEKNWKWKLNRPGKTNLPMVIHTGEGTDAMATKEIDELIRWNFFKKALVGVHGVAMTAKQARSFKALVWCAASNYFLLGSTANIKQLKQNTQILFGTDSTLTAGWNIWEQLRMARVSGMLSDKELFKSVTHTAASVWGWEKYGYLKEGYAADIVIAKNNGMQNSMEAFYAVNPEDLLLVVHQGKIRLFDASLDEQLSDATIQYPMFSRVKINGSIKSVAGDLPALMQQVSRYHSGAVLSPIQLVP
jgi:cytosine/adenosine deaminase-related metal-dependent hydrolase